MAKSNGILGIFETLLKVSKLNESIQNTYLFETNHKYSSNCIFTNPFFLFLFLVALDGITSQDYLNEVFEGCNFFCFFWFKNNTPPAKKKTKTSFLKRFLQHKTKNITLIKTDVHYFTRTSIMRDQLKLCLTRVL